MSTEREAGPASAGPAREHVVVRDKRKIDPTGRPRTAGSPGAGTDQGDGAADAAGASAAKEPTMGQPGTPVQKPGTPVPSESGVTAPAAEVDAAKAEAAKAEAAKTEVEDGTAVVAEEAGVAAADDVDTTVLGTQTVEAPKPLGAELEALRSELDERLRDLQRVSAEYANYRKRVERDRGLVAEQATGAVLGSLLPILDDLDRARDHGDLVGPFGAVAEQLTTALAKFGLIAFGEVGDRFDPTRHEAVAHETKADVSEPTCTLVMRRGYLLGDRLLRPALVAVADPE